MNNEYVIINKTELLKMMEETNNDIDDYYGHRKLLKHILSKSTPLIPEIEKAFDEGQNRMQHEIIEKLGLRYQIEQVSQSTILNMEVHSEDYISNLKLDI